jgi:hypothetical protein
VALLIPDTEKPTSNIFEDTPFLSGIPDVLEQLDMTPEPSHHDKYKSPTSRVEKRKYTPVCYMLEEISPAKHQSVMSDMSDMPDMSVIAESQLNTYDVGLPSMQDNPQIDASIITPHPRAKSDAAAWIPGKRSSHRQK